MIRTTAGGGSKMKINKPVANTQISEVLYMLLTLDILTYKIAVNRADICNLNSIISKLRYRYSLVIEYDNIESVNEFKRVALNGGWYLSDKEKALQLYNRINTESKKGYSESISHLDYELVVNYFKKHEDNSPGDIHKSTGISKAKIKYILNEYIGGLKIGLKDDN
jgi:hypothetical protein